MTLRWLQFQLILFELSAAIFQHTSSSSRKLADDEIFRIFLFAAMKTANCLHLWKLLFQQIFTISAIFLKALKNIFLWFHKFAKASQQRKGRKKNYFRIVFHLIACGRRMEWAKALVVPTEKETLFSEFKTRSVGTLEAKLSMTAQATN